MKDAYDVLKGTKTPAPTGTRYTVKSGDTLSGIAAKFKVSLAQLIAWNKISNPNSLYVGQVLQVKAVSSDKPSPVITPKNGAAALSKVQLPFWRYSWKKDTSLKPGEKLTPGMPGGDPRVSRFKNYLYAAGYFPKEVKPGHPTRGFNSGFGGTTRDAVKEFQRRNGLKVTGIVDRATYLKMGVRYFPKAKKS